LHPISSYLDLSKIYVYAQLCIKEVKNDGTLKDLDAAEVVAPINYIGATFIKNVKVIFISVICIFIIF
jgi:hypothetical protein